MIQRPPRSTRTDTLFPHTTLFRSLESLGISLEAVRSQVEEIIGQGGSSPSGHIPFTPRAKKVLELSLREALQLGHNYIGTEHIRSEEHTSELQSLMRISYAVFCLKKKKKLNHKNANSKPRSQ